MTRANRIPSRAGVSNDVSKYQLAVDVDAMRNIGSVAARRRITRSVLSTMAVSTPDSIGTEHRRAFDQRGTHSYCFADSFVAASRNTSKRNPARMSFLPKRAKGDPRWPAMRSPRSDELPQPATNITSRPRPTRCRISHEETLITLAPELMARCLSQAELGHR